MNIDKATGRLEGVPFVASPNKDERPAGLAIDAILIHNISLPPGRFGGGYVHKLFTNGLDHNEHPYFKGLVGLCVSAHCFIERDGHITQFVPFTERAWHAGASEYQGRIQWNDFSIGIELEGTDNQAYTDSQYLNLETLCRCLMETYPEISLSSIVGHADVAPQRKTDPGESFDWVRLRQSLEG